MGNLATDKILTLQGKLTKLNEFIRNRSNGYHNIEQEKSALVYDVLNLLKTEFDNLVAGTVTWSSIGGDINDNVQLAEALANNLTTDFGTLNNQEVIKYDSTANAWINTNSLSLADLSLSGLLKLASFTNAEETTANPATSGNIWYNSDTDRIKYYGSSGITNMPPARIPSMRMLGRTSANTGEVEQLVLNQVFALEYTLVNGTYTITEPSITGSSLLQGWGHVSGTLTQIPTFTITNGRCVVNAGASDDAVLHTSIIII